jgi:hypothetical protein
LIPESLDPLEELEVILEATFYETVDGDGFVDVVVCKGLLEDFEVLDILVLVLCLELVPLVLSWDGGAVRLP